MEIEQIWSGRQSLEVKVETAAVQKSYLIDALSMGPGYFQKVKMGGKTYYMLVIQGGSVSRIPPHKTQKLQDISETFFSAHKSASSDTLRDKEITYSLNILF